MVTKAFLISSNAKNHGAEVWLKKLLFKQRGYDESQAAQAKG